MLSSSSSHACKHRPRFLAAKSVRSGSVGWFLPASAAANPSRTAAALAFLLPASLLRRRVSSSKSHPGRLMPWLHSRAGRGKPRGRGGRGRGKAGGAADWVVGSGEARAAGRPHAVCGGLALLMRVLQPALLVLVLPAAPACYRTCHRCHLFCSAAHVPALLPPPPQHAWPCCIAAQVKPPRTSPVARNCETK